MKSGRTQVEAKRSPTLRTFKINDNAGRPITCALEGGGPEKPCYLGRLLAGVNKGSGRAETLGALI